jgi:hypothetical protein
MPRAAPLTLLLTEGQRATADLADQCRFTHNVARSRRLSPRDDVPDDVRRLQSCDEVA